MLRIYQSNASRDAKGYFDNELSKGDYYTEYQQVAGRWGGKSASMLGLVGDVDKDGFHALCDNLHPVTKGKLNIRTKEHRRVGYDISFHVPKSVSLLFEHSRDEAIIDAFRNAVSETMSEMETGVRTRTSVGLKKVFPITGNMVWAEFIHLTSRPVGGGVPDPHLHAHCFTFNTTYDSKEKRWKAGEFSKLYQDSLYYRTVFHARLAKGLKNLGYGIKRTENAFEIAGIPESLIRKFSKRTSEIEKKAIELGITDPDEKDKLGARSRQRKSLQYTKEELQAEWDKQFTPEESAAVRSVIANKSKGTQTSEITAKAAMDHALGHGFERASVMDHKKLLAEALHYGMGDLEVEDVISEGKRDEILTREIEGNLLSTTKEVLAEEKAMTHFARSTLNTRHYLVSDKEQILDNELNEEQVAGIKNIWSSYNQVMGIIGGAGVGKTRLMTEAIRGIEANGHKVFTFAPSASASRDTLRAEGFEAADTIARLFIDEELQQQLQNQVIWIDEAGLLGVRDMNKVFKIAKQYNCRVILSGDSKQHTPVVRGDALRILEKQAGIKFPEIRKIQRQKSETYRDAVYALSQGNVDKAFDKLESIEAIVEYKDDEERNSALAEEYYASIAAGEKVLIISPTHAEGEAVTNAVRDHLRQLDKLGSKEKTFVTLENLQLTESQKKDARNYEKGTVIEFHQNGFDMPVIGNIFDEQNEEESNASEDEDSDYYSWYGKDRVELRTRDGDNAIVSFSRTLKGYRHSRAKTSKGDSLYVLGKNSKGQIRVANKYGQILNLSLIQAARYQLYRPKLLSIAKNEKLLLTKNSRTVNNQKVNNGDLVRVKSFSKNGDIELSNGKTLSKNHSHLKYGYCTTSYASQGKTVDKILLAQSSKSKRASSKEQFYVSISRGKKMVKIFTDSKEALRNMVKSSSVRTSAQELIGTPTRTVRERIAERAYTVARLASTARAYASNAAIYTADKAKTAASAAKTVTVAAAGKAKTWAEKVGVRSPKLILPDNFKPSPGGPDGPRTI